MKKAAAALLVLCMGVTFFAQSFGVAAASVPLAASEMEQTHSVPAPASETPPEAAPAAAQEPDVSGVLENDFAGQKPPAASSVSLPQNEPKDEEDLVSSAPQSAQERQELLELAQTDGAQTARLLNEITDEQAHSETLRAVLTFYYEQQEPRHQLAAFLAALDARADEMVAHFANAAHERAQGANLGYVPGEVLVVFKETVSEQKAADLLEEQDDALEVQQVLETLGEQTAVVAELPLDVTVEQAVQTYEQDPNLAHVQPNYVYVTMDEPPISPQAGVNDPDANKQSGQWHLDALHVFEAWDYIESLHLQGRSKVRVAVVDGEPNPTHPDLAGNLNAIDSRDVSGGEENLPLQGHYSGGSAGNHGAHVAGLIGAVANNTQGGVGVASGYNNEMVELISMAFFKEDGTGTTATLIPAISCATKQGAKVINMSIGAVNLTTSITRPQDLMMKDAVDSALQQGVVVVAAAGNKGARTAYPVGEGEPGKYNIPGDLENVISVINLQDNRTSGSGLDSYVRRTGASGSNYGPTKDISAPGTSVLSTGLNGYYKSSGTSMSAPIVSGVAALMLYVNPTLSPVQVRAILNETAADLNTPGFDEETAWGIVDARAAVQAAYEAGNATFPATSVRLHAPAEPLAVGAKANILATVLPANSTDLLFWSCDNPTVANVSENGLVTAIGAGVARITARSFSNKEGECEVVVAHAAPSGLRISTSFDSLHIGWDSVPGAEGYSVYRAAQSSGVYELVGAVSQNTYADTAVQLDETYSYKVAVYFTHNGKKIESAQSEAIAGVLKFAQISGVSAAPKAAGGIALSWNAVAGASGYFIERASQPNAAYEPLNTAPAGSTDFSDNTALAGFAYCYCITPFRDTAQGRVRGAASAVATAICPLADVQGVRAVSVGFESVSLQWNTVAGAAGYEVHRANAQGGTYALVAKVEGLLAAYIDTGLATNTAYYYKVRAYSQRADERVFTQLSAAVSATPALDKMTQLSAQSVTHTSNRLRWAGLAGASGYHIYRADPKNRAYKQVGTANAGAAGYTDKKLDIGVTYSYKVRAYRSASGAQVNTGWSGIVKCKTGVPAPESLKATRAGHDSVRLRWGASAGSTGYYIYRADAQRGKYKLIGTNTGAKARQYTDVSLRSGSEYYYKILPFRKQKNRIYKGAWSETAMGKPQVGRPAAFKAKATAKGITLSWQGAKEADGYRLYRAQTKEGRYRLVKTLQAHETSATDAPRVQNKGTTFYYKLIPFCKLAGRKADGLAAGPVGVKTR